MQKRGLYFVTGIACQGKPQVYFLVLVLIFAYYSGQGSLKRTCFCFRSYTKNLAITLEEKDCPPIKGTVTQKSFIFFMIENGIYSAKNLKLNIYFK